jgi:PAS domain S-box-containing protein
MAKILVADDQPLNRQYLVTLLEYFGHRLLEASNGAEAFRLAKTEHPHLVISDLLMPVVDGQELAKRMRADTELATIPILFYSANYSWRQAKAVAEDVGAFDVLPKPGDPQVIVDIVQKALQRHSSDGVESPAEVRIPGDFERRVADVMAITSRLATPLEMSFALAAERDPWMLLLGLTRMARELIGAKYSAAGLLSTDGLSVHAVLSTGAGDISDFQDDAAEGVWPRALPAPPAGSILADVVAKQQPVRARDVETAQLHLPILGCTPLRSLLAVPLAPENTPGGWLLLANRLGGEDFTEADEQVVCALAAQGASAYQRVDERLRGEDDLRKSRAMLEALFEAAPDAMLATGRDGVVRSANSQTAAMFGYSPTELIGMPIEKLVPDRLRASHAAQRQQFNLDPRLRPMGAGLELSGRRKDGSEFPVDVMLSPLETAAGPLVLSVVRDITERRANEIRISELNRQLQIRVDELQSANQSLEAFSYSVSHDLRAPLRAIDGFARVISEDYKTLLDQEAHRLLDVIASNCHKMGKLIEDLLAFSRVSRGHVLKSEMDMTALARSVIDEFLESEPARQVAAVVHDLPPALGDRALVRQVFINLVGNAWKFTRRAPLAAIEIGSYNNGKVHVYFVKDNGVGFDDRYANRLFSVFQRLHAEGEFEGSGIGLALVYRIVQRHGGDAWATGKTGEGATFCFTLADGPGRDD